MFFGANLQFLRRKRAMTQEQLAQELNVSRQTVSKWESGQTPELGKLMELSDLFSCKLDDLLRLDLSMEDTPVRVYRLPGFSMARYCMISPHAYRDLRACMDAWAAQAGLQNAKYLCWSLPYVPADLKNRHGLQGFGAAWVLPGGQFSCGGPEFAAQEAHTYAVLTISEPAGRNAKQIARAIQTILEYLHRSGIPKSAQEGYLPSFELRYTRDGLPMADIFLQCQAPGITETYSF